MAGCQRVFKVYLFVLQERKTRQKDILLQGFSAVLSTYIVGYFIEGYVITCYVGGKNRQWISLKWILFCRVSFFSCKTKIVGLENPLAPNPAKRLILSFSRKFYTEFHCSNLIIVITQEVKFISNVLNPFLWKEYMVPHTGVFKKLYSTPTHH